MGDWVEFRGHGSSGSLVFDTKVFITFAPHVFPLLSSIDSVLHLIENPSELGMWIYHIQFSMKENVNYYFIQKIFDYIPFQITSAPSGMECNQ